jgi:hypothetical protein
MNTTFDHLVVHQETDLHAVWNLMHFTVPVDPMSPKLFSRIPTKRRVVELSARLRRSSCAVVGASSTLSNCYASRDICAHDIVIHVNDHAGSLKLCPRVDVQLVNQHTCFWRPSSNGAKAGFYTQPQTGPLRECKITPTLVRIRHEWNPQRFDRFSRGALLSSGVINRVARNRVGKCCASAGGVAASLALEACRRVTAFGLAGVNRSHFDSRSRMPPLHDVSRERDWMIEEERRGRLRRAC